MMPEKSLAEVYRWGDKTLYLKMLNVQESQKKAALTL